MKYAQWILTLLLLLTIGSVYGLTAAIGNARMVVSTEVPQGETVIITRSIMVENRNEVPVLVTLEADPKFALISQILDNDFILQPAEKKQAQFVITLESGGNYDGRILVLFSSTDPESKDIPAGLTSTIFISADGPVTDAYYAWNSTVI